MGETKIIGASGGRDLAVCEWGPPGGSPVFLLHGTPGSRYLRDVGGEYERTGARVITYDRPGYARSTRMPGRSVADATDDVTTIADVLGIGRFAVVGISGGGPHALAVSAAYPQRVSRCATLVGIGAYGAEDLDFFAGMAADEVQQWDCAIAGEDCLSGQFYVETLKWVESLSDIKDLPAHIRDMLVEAFREALTPGPGGMVDDYAALLRPWGFDLADVRCPAQVLAAQDDTSVPPAHGRWLVKTPGVR